MYQALQLQQQALQQQQQALQQHATQASEDWPRPGGSGDQSPPAAAASQEAGLQALVSMCPGSLAAQLFGIKQELGGGAQAQQLGGLLQVPHMPLPANAPPVSWLPAPDIYQDQKLRPPAA